MISLPISGALAQSYAGWPSIFYVFGKFSQLLLTKVINKSEQNILKYWHRHDLFKYQIQIIQTGKTCAKKNSPRLGPEVHIS